MTILLDIDYPEQMDRLQKAFDASCPVALPTETVYGLAAPFDDIHAVKKIFSLKDRSFDQILPVAVSTWSQARNLWAENYPPLLEKMTEVFWPGPLTIVFSARKNWSEYCVAPDGSIALRCPDQKHIQSVIKKTGKALALTSANISGKKSPRNIQEVLDQLGPRGLEAIVNGGESEYGYESTILSVSADSFTILREGALSENFIREKLGC